MSSTVLAHVTVIDATGAPPQPDMNVVVTGERITGLHESGTMPTAPGATVVDASGKYVIPGLWDMHTHTMGSPLILPLYLANGVTGIREMWGHPHHHEWRAQIDSGELLGPRMVIASKIVDGPGSMLAGWMPGGVTVVADEASGRDAVREAVDSGADLVKVYSFLPPPAYFAIAREAQRQGIVFAGHVPDQVPATEASEAGQHTCEHLLGVFPATSSRQEEIRKEADSIARTVSRERGALFRRWRELDEMAAETYDPSRAAAVFELFVRNGTWQVPTLSVLRIGMLDESALDDERLRYLPSGTLQYWTQMLPGLGTEPDQLARARRFFARRAALVGDMKQAGVGILAGTDCGNPFVFPGFSLHDELAFLVQGGLTPMQALQAATRDAAGCLGKLDDLGTVSAGKLADLVLLDANPLDDIRNTQRIDAVMIGGRLLTRAELRSLLDDVEAAAERPPTA